MRAKELSIEDVCIACHSVERNMTVSQHPYFFGGICGLCQVGEATATFKINVNHIHKIKKMQNKHKLMTLTLDKIKNTQILYVKKPKKIQNKHESFAQNSRTI